MIIHVIAASSNSESFSVALTATHIDLKGFPLKKKTLNIQLNLSPKDFSGHRYCSIGFTHLSEKPLKLCPGPDSVTAAQMFRPNSISTVSFHILIWDIKKKKEKKKKEEEGKYKQKKKQKKQKQKAEAAEEE